MSAELGNRLIPRKVGSFIVDLPNITLPLR